MLRLSQFNLGQIRSDARLTTLALAAALWLSGTTMSTVLAASPAEEPERLSIGDKVTVQVFGQGDLSGDFVIDGAGMVQMPLVGRIPVAGLTAPQAESRIRDGLMDGFVRGAVVSLRIAELKPVYIMGEVRSPGSYPFRHGLNVLSAVALAGGYRVGDQSVSVLRAEFLLADERVRLLEASRDQLAARRARLEAERDGLPRIPASAGLGASPIVAGEQEIFDFQRKARDSERNLLRQQVARLESEKTALTQQAKLAQQQVDLTRENASEYTKLAASGLALRNIQVEREREYARTRSDVARIEADIAKNETALGELSLRLADTDAAFMRRVVTELQETRAKILEVERSLPVARELAEGRRRRLAADEASGGAGDWDIRVTRQAGLEARTLPAGFETVLRPGDVVQIMPKPGSRDQEAISPSPPPSIRQPGG